MPDEDDGPRDDDERERRPVERQPPGRAEDQVPDQGADNRRERAHRRHARERESDGEESDRAGPRRRRAEEERTKAGGDAASAASAKQRRPAVPGHRGYRADRFRDGPARASGREEQLREPHSERAFEDVEHRNQDARARTESA